MYKLEDAKHSGTFFTGWFCKYPCWDTAGGYKPIRSWLDAEMEAANLLNAGYRTHIHTANDAEVELGMTG